MSNLRDILSIYRVVVPFPGSFHLTQNLPFLYIHLTQNEFLSLHH